MCNYVHLTVANSSMQLSLSCLVSLITELSFYVQITEHLLRFKTKDCTSTHFCMYMCRVPDIRVFSSLGVNAKFQRVNSHYFHQIITNFLSVCRVMQVTLSGF